MTRGDTATPSAPTELFEALASNQHDIWASWQRYLHSRCYRVWVSGVQVFMVGADGVTVAMRGGELVIPADSVKHWERQIATPYADLTPAEQVSDREQVLKMWPLIADFVAQWVVDNTPGRLDFGYDWLRSRGADVLAEEWSAELAAIKWEFCPSCGATVKKSSIEAGHRPDCSLVPRLGSVGDGD
jgi:hypothetical protein